MMETFMQAQEMNVEIWDVADHLMPRGVVKDKWSDAVIKLLLPTNLPHKFLSPSADVRFHAWGISAVVVLDTTI